MASFYHTQPQWQGLGYSLFLGHHRRSNYHGKTIFPWWHDNVQKLWTQFNVCYLHHM